MGERVATLIIEPRSLVCEGLVSLMASHSYHVVGGVASTADIDSSLLVADVPKLVILGALPAEEAATAASCIRKLWPDTKIILLFERASSTDYQNWQASEIDGCIPLSVSPDVLIGTLQQILEGDLKILVHEAASRSVIALPSARLPIAPVVTNEEARIGAFDGSFSIRVRHGLSEREEQVLRDLVKGLPNKIDRPQARHCRSNGQGSFEVDPAKDPDGEPNSGSHLGARKWLRRPGPASRAAAA